LRVLPEILTYWRARSGFRALPRLAEWPARDDFFTGSEVSWRTLGPPMSGRERKDVRPGLRVEIVQKQDQRTGRRTRGVVQDVLTRSPTHPHGIKVRLTTGEVGRVQEIVSSA
jgi:uncharacterized repeat protein (TIGR03833 family)